MISTAPASATILARRRSSPSSSTHPNQHSTTAISSSTVAPREDILRLIAECDATLEHDFRCLHTRAVRGHACMKAKLWERAITDFSQILASRPDDVHGRFSRGMALFKSGRVEDAHADFSRVLELNPHHVMARYARAGCYNTEGKFHHAIQDYTIALQHDEKEQDAVTGVRHGLRGWHEGAEKLVNEKLSASDTVRKHRGAGIVQDGGGHGQRRATTSVIARESDGVEEERRRASVATVGPPDKSDRTSTKKPRKVVQISLNMSAAPPTSQTPEVAPAARAPATDWSGSLSPRYGSPRSKSRLQLQCVPASHSATRQQSIDAAPSTRQPTHRMENHDLWNVTDREQSPRVEAVCPPSKLSIKQLESTHVPGAQPHTKRAVRRVTIALGGGGAGL